MDMLEMVAYGKAMSKHFFNCEPIDCIKQLNEVLNAVDISAFDYNFLIGVRRGVEEHQ